MEIKPKTLQQIIELMPIQRKIAIEKRIKALCQDRGILQDYRENEPFGSIQRENYAAEIIDINGQIQCLRIAFKEK